MNIEVVVPPVGESVNEVVVAAFKKQDGDFVREDEEIIELESDKATQSLPAPKAGIIKYLVKVGDTLKIGTVVCQIDTAATAAPAPTAPLPSENTPAGEPSHLQEQLPIKLSPAAAKMARENQVDTAPLLAKRSKAHETSPITKEEMEQFIKKEQELVKNHPAKAVIKDVPAPSVKQNGQIVERKKMSLIRKTIAKKLLEVKQNTAMLTSFNEVDMEKIIELRKEYKDEFLKKHQVSLGFMSLFTKAAAEVLLEIKELNAMIDGDEIVYHHYVNMGIAVSTPRGLVVPVIQNVHLLSIAEIEKEIQKMATKGRDGKLTVDEMKGGTFTITNGGVFGSMLSTPLLNSPQVGILGMHNIVERPVAVKGQVVIKPIMYLALSYDHRLVDGKEAVTFLKRMKEYLENPARLLLQV